MSRRLSGTVKIRPGMHLDGELPGEMVYARDRGQCMPSRGADLVGYLAPHEGSTTTAYGVCHIGSLAEYEAYRERRREHPLGKSNHELAQRGRFLLKEDRLFLRLASAPHAETSKS